MPDIIAGSNFRSWMTPLVVDNIVKTFRQGDGDVQVDHAALLRR
jgi:hypothetical protein